MATKFVTVKSGRKDNRTALWETSPDHPDGEIFVAGDTPVKAARTRRVEAALKAGVLVEAGDKDAPTTTATVGPIATANPMTAAEVRAETAPDVAPQTVLGTVGGIADYDKLSVSEVVERLSGLSDASRLDVRTYEATRRNRRGVMDALGE